MIVSIKNNWIDIKETHNEYVKSRIDSFTSQPLRKNNLSMHTVDFLLENGDLIVSDKLDDLIRSARHFDMLIAFNSTTPNVIVRLKRDLKKIFNYKAFTDKKKSYDAYDLCAKSKSRTCPYCNQAFAFTVQDLNGSFRPTLDHFFSKDLYPHLALSLSNLIPSCSTCNSSLKNIKDFYLHPHLHPLFDDENVQFILTGKTNREKINILSDINEKDVEIDLLPTACKKTNLSIETFLIKKRYQYTIFEAVSFAKNIITLDEYSRNSQLKLTSEINISSALLFDTRNYSNSILGKLFHDIYNQLKNHSKKVT